MYVCVCVCVCVLTLTEMKKKKVEAEESWDMMMMMMMMRMGGSVPHLDFDFVDGEWTMFQRKVACVCKCVTGRECGTERYIKTKQPNTHSSPYTHNQGKVSFLNNSLLQLVFRFNLQLNHGQSVNVSQLRST